MKLYLSKIEYIALRMIRKFLFTDGLLTKIADIIPYYRKNIGEFDPNLLIEQYCKYCNQLDLDIKEKSILEIGIGRTNSSGYKLLARGVKKYYGLEPYIDLNLRLDQQLYDQISQKHSFDRSQVYRLSNLDSVEKGSIDIILSNSVLEHIKDLPGLLPGLSKVLKDEGSMLHFIDYRDHFFKYPYHFLLFSKFLWHYFLNPGDLHRYRISYHLNLFKKYNFSVDVIEKKQLTEEFEAIKTYIHPDFKQMDAKDLAVSHGVLFVRKR